MVNASISEIIDLFSDEVDRYRQRIFFKIIGIFRIDEITDSVFLNLQPWYDEVIKDYEACSAKKKANMFWDGVPEFKIPKIYNNLYYIKSLPVDEYLNDLSDDGFKNLRNAFMWFICCKYGVANNNVYDDIPSFPCSSDLANIGYLFNEDIT